MRSLFMVRKMNTKWGGHVCISICFMTETNERNFMEFGFERLHKELLGE